MKPFMSRLFGSGGDRQELPASKGTPGGRPQPGSPGGAIQAVPAIFPARTAPPHRPSPRPLTTARTEAGPSFAALPNVVAQAAETAPGWEIGRVVTVFAPVMLLELVRTADPAQPSEPPARTYRMLGRRGEMIATTPDQLPDHLTRQMRETVELAIAAAATSGDKGNLDRFCRQFRTLDRGFRLELMHHLFRNGGTPPMLVLNRRLAGDETDNSRIKLDCSGGFVSVVVDGGLEFPVVLAGKPLDRFIEGWQPVALITNFAPLLLIELRHNSGVRATWVLDERFARIDDAGFGHEKTIARMREAGPALIRRHWLRILALGDDRPDPVLDPLLRLNGGALWRMFLLCRELVCPSIDDLTLDQIIEPLIIPAAAGQSIDLVLPPDAVRHAVSHDLLAAGLAGIRSGRFVWPSPVDGSDAELEAIFAPQEHTIFYQFRDRNGLRFIVLTGDRRCRTVGLLIPSANLAIGSLDRPNSWFRAATGAEIWTILMGQCIGHYDMVLHRRRRGDAEIVQVFMARPLLHLGHYVWNDLPGQLALIEAVPDRLPKSIIIDSAAGQAEFFGPLDALLPACAGKVDRSMRDTSAFVHWVYNTPVVPIRFTGDHVSRSLRDAVRTYTAGTTEFGEIAERVRGRNGGRVIIIGLRLDDRTFIDQDAFYASLLEHLALTSPGALVVFDGRNSKPGGRSGETIAGMKDDLATRPPLEAEQELVDRLVRRFSGSGLEFVSTIGLSMQHSMSWCYHADYCVGVWGAGLAKYRWLANLPSLILTSRFNIEKRPDLDIYHSARWMQDPSIVMYPEPGFVTDHLDKVGLSDSGMRVGRECFEIDAGHVRDRLDQLIAAIGDRRPDAAQLSA